MLHKLCFLQKRGSQKPCWDQLIEPYLFLWKDREVGGRGAEATMEGAGLYQIGFVTLPTKAQSSLKFLVFSLDLSRRPHSELLRNFVWQLLSKPFDCPRMENSSFSQVCFYLKTPVGWFWLRLSVLSIVCKQEGRCSNYSREWTVAPRQSLRSQS